MILGTKCTCVIRTCGMTEAALGIAPGNPPILYAKAAPVVVSGGIRVKVPLYIGNTHVTPLCNMPKCVRYAGITEGWRVGARIESSRGVISGQADLDLRKTLRDQYVGRASKRGLVGNDHVGDGSCAIFIGILKNSIDGSVEFDGSWSNGVKNTSGTHLVEFFSHMIGICQHCWIVARHFVKRFDGTIIAGNMPPMSNTTKHMMEVAVGLHRGVRETCWTAGDMKQRHVVSLKIVRRWIKENSAGPEQTWIEHFEHVESTGLENRRWTMRSDAVGKEIPAEAPLDEAEGE